MPTSENVFVLCHGEKGELFGTPSAVCTTLENAKAAAYKAEQLEWFDDAYTTPVGGSIPIWRAEFEYGTYTIHEFPLDGHEVVIG